MNLRNGHDEGRENGGASERERDRDRERAGFRVQGFNRAGGVGRGLPAAVTSRSMENIRSIGPDEMEIGGIVAVYASRVSSPKSTFSF